MIEYRSDFASSVRATAPARRLSSPPRDRRLAPLFLVVSTPLPLTACDQFDRARVVDTCVLSAMKHAEPFGNAKERAESEAQFRPYCAMAAARKHL
jgi:hypothetical protein